jgi:hypothetical protein
MALTRIEKHVEQLEAHLLLEYQKQSAQREEQIKTLTGMYQAYDASSRAISENFFTNYAKWQQMQPNLTHDQIMPLMDMQLSSDLKAFEQSREVLLKFIDSSKEMSEHLKVVFETLASVIKEEFKGYQEYRIKIIENTDKTVQEIIKVQEQLFISSQGSPIKNPQVNNMKDKTKDTEDKIQPNPILQQRMFKPPAQGDKVVNSSPSKFPSFDS